MGRHDDEDKQWAKAYILDPLTAPEPSQLDGPGTSFFNPKRSLSVRSQKGKEPAPDPQVPRRQPSLPSYPIAQPHPRRRPSLPSYPTPPQSASPGRSSFHSSNPWSPNYTGSRRSPPAQSDWAPASTILSRSDSINSHSAGHLPHSPRSPPRSPEWYRPDNSDWYPPPNPKIGRSRTVRSPPQTHHTQGFTDWRENPFGPSLSRSNSVTSNGLRRSNSLSQRYPGDMSHRPLDMIKRDNRAADKAPHLRRKNAPGTDTIDSLDSSAIGGAYHHGGPYDATLAPRNNNKLYSPVEAVKDSNMEAIKATPSEYINDSLRKHVPLQGTASVPPGMADMRGRVMNYQEGADLMREADAPGGPYKRWDGIRYHPDDLKGKGEPSFTVERDLKEHKAKLRKHASSSNGGVEFEMQPHVNGAHKNGDFTVRQRSVSNVAHNGAAAGPSSPNGYSTNNDLRRHNTTGRRFADGLKRRFGSFRRKQRSEE